eukprot:15481990-Alexandrium_andersonii.AAC.1
MGAPPSLRVFTSRACPASFAWMRGPAGLMLGFKARLRCPAFGRLCAHAVRQSWCRPARPRLQ